MDVVQGAGSVTRAGVFLYPKDKDMTAEDFDGFMSAFVITQADKLHQRMDWYLGDHPILHEDPKGDNRPDNHLVINLPFSNVDTFNGYFIGKNPKIALPDKDDANTALQQWNDSNSFQDKLAEISKQTDIYGRAFAFVYQNEDADTRVTYSDPETSFMIYDDTVEQLPLAFVTFTYDEHNRAQGRIYFKDHSSVIRDDRLVFDDDLTNVYAIVPAVEFISNDERQGLNDQVFGIADTLDRAMSQKANQNEYFDNAYMVIQGLDLDWDGDGEPEFTVDGNQILYSPDQESANGKVSFLEKPDGDALQEHLIDRLIEQNYNITGVVNFNDSRITGNMTGKALERLLQRMSNRAVFKQTKFTQCLRELYRIVFAAKMIKGIDAADWTKLDFKFYENLPADYSDEANTAKTLEGITSKQTQLKTLSSIVKDPAAEMKLIQQEQTDAIKNATIAAGTATDADKAIPQVNSHGEE